MGGRQRASNRCPTRAEQNGRRDYQKARRRWGWRDLPGRAADVVGLVPRRGRDRPLYITSKRRRIGVTFTKGHHPSVSMRTQNVFSRFLFAISLEIQFVSYCK